MFVTSGNDCGLCFWKQNEKGELEERKYLKGKDLIPKSKGASIFSMIWSISEISSDGIIGVGGRTVHKDSNNVWFFRINGVSPELISSCMSRGGEVYDITVLDEGVFLTSSNNTFLWNFRQDEPVKSWKGEHTEMIRSMCKISSHLFATSSYDQTCKMFDIDRNSSLQTFKGHQNEINGITYGGNNNLFSVGDDKHIFMWDINSSSKNPVSKFSCGTQLLSVCSFPEFHQVSAGTENGRIIVYDTRFSSNILRSISIVGTRKWIRKIIQFGKREVFCCSDSSRIMKFSLPTWDLLGFWKTRNEVYDICEIFSEGGYIKKDELERLSFLENLDKDFEIILSSKKILVYKSFCY